MRSVQNSGTNDGLRGLTYLHTLRLLSALCGSYPPRPSCCCLSTRPLVLEEASEQFESRWARTPLPANFLTGVHNCRRSSRLPSDLGGWGRFGASLDKYKKALPRGIVQGKERSIYNREPEGADQVGLHFLERTSRNCPFNVVGKL